MKSKIAVYVARGLVLVGVIMAAILSFVPARIVEVRLSQPMGSNIQGLDTVATIPVLGIQVSVMVHVILVAELVLMAAGVVFGRRMLAGLGAGAALMAVLAMILRPADPLTLAAAAGKNLPSSAAEATTSVTAWGLWGLLATLAVLLVASLIASGRPLRRIAITKQSIGPKQIGKTVQHQSAPDECNRRVDEPHIHARRQLVAKVKAKHPGD